MRIMAENKTKLSEIEPRWIILINPLAPKSDYHLNSPYSILPESNVKVMRIEVKITN